MVYISPSLFFDVVDVTVGCCEVVLNVVVCKLFECDGVLWQGEACGSVLICDCKLVCVFIVGLDTMAAGMLF